MKTLAILFRLSFPSMRTKLLGFRSVRLLVAILLFSGLPAAAVPERVWTAHTPDVGPRARRFPAMAYVGVRQRVLLFGGQALDQSLPGFAEPLADTWEWDGMRWSSPAPSTSPSPRWGHALAYDSARQRVVLFGGTNAETDMNDTWEWDGEEWVQRAPTVSPPARWNHALAYDSRRERVVLFGGVFVPPLPGMGPPVLFGDTWEWDGDEWVQRTPLVSPPARRGHGLAYDSGRDRTVLIGGSVGCCSVMEAWEWDGSEWVRPPQPALRPAPRHNIILVYDDERERVVFFGGRWEGFFGTTFFFDEVTDWDGFAWSIDELPPLRPFERSDAGLAYDSARGELVLFGTHSFPDPTTWVYSVVPEGSCDGVDDNDNGLVDEGCDDDGDGYCDVQMTVVGTPAACPRGGGDCNDGDSAIRPGAADIPGDVVDEDCDGTPACDPQAVWRNHGEFISCIARECARLSGEGTLSGEKCSRLTAGAAQGAIGP